jgi:histidinol dehydrogenase
MRTVFWNQLSATERRRVLARPQRRSDPRIIETVTQILHDVERGGEAAVARWSRELDGAEPEFLECDPVAVDTARSGLDRDDVEALERAAQNIEAYHTASQPVDLDIEIENGVRCRRLWRPASNCGLYIPGGSAPLFSTLLMLAIPAKVAGVANTIAVTPPRKGGGAHPMMVAAAALAGLDGLWLVGGAQAIAALAFGAGLPKADKIFGPGNTYVAEAKRQIAARGDLAAIDLPAGPSELMLIADQHANAATIAADLLSQAEHDRDAQVILVSTSAGLSERVAEEVAIQVRSLPRAEIAHAALENSVSIIADEIPQAIEIANDYAPEHLALHIADAEDALPDIINAGAVFVGGASAESFGDYTCGPSHVLPTEGAARMWSGVTTASFMKSMSVQRLSAAAAQSLAAATARLARAESLEAHARAAERRL